MADIANTGFTPEPGNELNIESIISAPLVAASKANAFMLTGQTRFILDNCFRKNDKGTYEPIMIDMSISRSSVKGNIADGGKGESVKVSESESIIFSVPMISLVPFNSIAVEKVTVDFDLEITSVGYSESSKSSSGQAGEERPDKNILDKKAQLRGKVSYDSGDVTGSGSSRFKSRNASRLKVNINAGTLPLPIGLLALLDVYSKTIQPRTTDTNKS